MVNRNVDVGGYFELTDHHGRLVTPDSYRGHYLLVFFGFTHCQQICPAVLTRNSGALELLGSSADTIQPLYVTVDPARDTPEQLADYLARRHPRYVGLTGTADQIEAAKRAYHVFSRRADELDNYTVPHTSFTFLMDPVGQYITHFPETLTAADLAEKLSSHINSHTPPGLPQQQVD
ncbi:hypothetical protein A5761_04355 [Mycolicibacterium setense]|uniref:SCO family protein n=1 Tax=Mycolicibacterium setense TaxID=431269 RepID=UPI0007EBE61A|nr:SCO family protein [Mycolicibacterium setense]OBB20928.1 hypothetical protein A5761_04355 [Mycolicibacterium setense]